MALHSRIHLTQCANTLFDALRRGEAIAPLSSSVPGLSIDDAYAISLDLLERRIADGERVIGKKIGVTSKAVQDMLGVNQPDFGFLTDRMQVTEAISLRQFKLIQPRAEAEIAFVLRNGLTGPGITIDQVIAATEAVAPCFEIVDSRIRDWQIGIIDTIADNASSGVFALGEACPIPEADCLPDLKVTVWKNDVRISEGFGSASLGNPAASVAWLANTLGRYGVSLDAGDVILSGSLVPLEPVAAGDMFRMDINGLGSCQLRFT
jgi:2-oxopent-4-enoate/cis-2-oxohex-4-enoate hydratase